MYRYPVGQTVKVHRRNDNENYNAFRSKILRITHVACSKAEHPGYDSGVKEPLYDLETLEGVPIGCSLYHYELEIVYGEG